ncbi:Fur family transcriptional regulator [Streptomyces sp. NBC_01591]|uniref:Fur family transcriptional regulator n=1 Tax=Streptomyces sp. NBC_01591 TaxID=2975888 RepID=UPI003FA3A986
MDGHHIALRALIRADGFVSAQALRSHLAADGSPADLPTVHRTLTAVADAGRADLVRDTNGERLFRYRADPDHRHYLICTECGLSGPSAQARSRTGPTTWRKPPSSRTSGTRSNSPERVPTGVDDVRLPNDGRSCGNQAYLGCTSAASR